MTTSTVWAVTTHVGMRSLISLPYTETSH